MIPVVVIAIVLFECTVVQVQCGDFIPDRVCATLFANSNFSGEAFTLKDFDQSANLKMEYRHSLNGWRKTGSVRLEKGCEIAMYNKTYFMGSRNHLNDNNTNLNKRIAQVQSAKCWCERKCSCEDIFIPKDDNEYGSIGRAYIKEVCDTCDTKYVSLQKKPFSGERENLHINVLDGHPVTAFTLRSGCNITIFSERDYKGSSREIPGPVYEVPFTLSQRPSRRRYFEPVGSYKYRCDDAQYVARPPSKNDNYPNPITLPTNRNTLFEMLQSNNEFANSTGFRVALDSARKGRSASNAYIIVIGYIELYSLGFHQCKNTPVDGIGECHIPVFLRDLGISTQLRVITVPTTHSYNGSIIEDNTSWMASLDNYLSSHEELNTVIPNAVIICFADIAHSLELPHSFLQLQAVQSLRTHLLDESYSNIVFLQNLKKIRDPSGQRQPDGVITQFQELINSKWAFPNPLAFCVRTEMRSNMLYVNGHVIMENEELWPKTLQVSLENICEKGGDPLGQAIFKAAFQDVGGVQFEMNSIPIDFATQDSIVKNKYRKIISSLPPQQGNETEFKLELLRELAQVKWEQKLHLVQHEIEMGLLKAELANEKRNTLEDGKELEKRIFENLQEYLRNNTSG